MFHLGTAGYILREYLDSDMVPDEIHVINIVMYRILIQWVKHNGL
jgi:hypothetical protein